jgi:hypothetical protein
LVKVLLDFVKNVGPQLPALGTALGKLFVALVPLLPPLGRFLSSISVAIVKGFTDLAKALLPLAVALAEMAGPLADVAQWLLRLPGAAPALASIVASLLLWSKIKGLIWKPQVDPKELTGFGKVLKGIVDESGLSTAFGALKESAKQTAGIVVGHLVDIAKGAGKLAIDLAKSVAGMIKSFVKLVVEHGIEAAIWIAQNAAMIASAVAAFIAENIATLGIAAAIALLVAGIIWLATHWKESWDFIKKVAKEIWEWLGSKWGWLIALFFPIGTFIALAAHWKQVWGMIRDVGLAIWHGIDDAWQWLWGRAKWIWGLITGTISSLWNGLVDIAKRVWNDVKNAFIRGINDVTGVINTIFIKPIDVALSIVGLKIPTIPQLQAEAGMIFATGKGGVTPGPIVLAGEGNPNYPEFVIPTDPKYKQSSAALLSQLLHTLGIPGFAGGGIFGWAKSAWSTVTGFAGDLTGSLEKAFRGFAADAIHSTLEAIAAPIEVTLSHIPPSALGTMAKGTIAHSIDDITNWVAGKKPHHAAMGAILAGPYLASYDMGGILPPGITMAINTTGQPERVTPMSRAGGPALNIGEFHAHDEADVKMLLNQMDFHWQMQGRGVG